MVNLVQSSMFPTGNKMVCIKIKVNQGTSLLYSITVSAEVNSGMTVETSATQSSLVSHAEPTSIQTQLME